jgi:hypothetical protein
VDGKPGPLGPGVFTLRRHVCRERSNDRERLFAKLCELDVNDPILDELAAYR